jgi:hypothetical protein
MGCKVGAPRGLARAIPPLITLVNLCGTALIFIRSIPHDDRPIGVLVPMLTHLIKIKYFHSITSNYTATTSAHSKPDVNLANKKEKNRAS